MAEITITIPDPIFETIKKRAEMTKSTPEQLVTVATILCYSATHYDDSKWLRNMDASTGDMTAPW